MITTVKNRGLRLKENYTDYESLLNPECVMMSASRLGSARSSGPDRDNL